MKKRWKDQALEFCIEIFEDYTKAEVLSFSSGIQRAWKVGKRAFSLNNKKLKMNTCKHDRNCPIQVNFGCDTKTCMHYIIKEKYQDIMSKSTS